MDTTVDTIPPPSSSGTDDPSPEAEGSTCTVRKLTLEYLNYCDDYHRGASLSKQHTDLLICHSTKQDLSHTARTANVSVAT